MCGSSRPTCAVAAEATALRVRRGWPRTPGDLVAVLDALGVDRAVVVGHSMGAFVALVFGDLYPDRVSRLVLVDGGLPLDVPAGLSSDEVIQLVLGPTAERLAMRFASVDEYLDFWRAHPAFRRRLVPGARGVPRVRPGRRGAGAAPGDELRHARGGLDRPELGHGRHRRAGARCGIRPSCSPPSGVCSTRCRRCTRRSACPGCSRRTPGCGTCAVDGCEPLHDRAVGARGGCCRRGGSGASWRDGRTRSLSDTSTRVAARVAVRERVADRQRRGRMPRRASSAGARGRAACGRGRRGGRGRSGTPRR